MKRILNILTAALLLLSLATSCESTPTIQEGIIGEWQLTEMAGVQSSELSTYIYIDFHSDMSFDMFQKVGQVTRYRKFVGTYSLTGSIISGQYKDGKKWGSDYRATLEADGQVLVLTAVTLDDAGAVADHGSAHQRTAEPCVLRGHPPAGVRTGDAGAHGLQDL